jgi:CpXC protein
MSLCHSVVVGCASCRRTKVVMLWQSLNADVSPEAREQLLEGKINVFECDGCGQIFPIATPP